MEFIKAEEFLGQPVEVQKALLDWWKDKKEDTDLVQIELYHGPEIKTYERIKSCNLMLGLEFYPLYTEGQLRQFIENKGYVIKVSTYDGYEIEISIPADNSPGWLIKKWTLTGDDLLNLYWQVATEIEKKEKVKNVIVDEERKQLINKLQSMGVSDIHGKNIFTMPLNELKGLCNWVKKKLEDKKV